MKELKDSSMFSIGEADKGAKKAPASKAAATTKAAPVKNLKRPSRKQPHLKQHQQQRRRLPVTIILMTPFPSVGQQDFCKGGKKHTRRARSHKRKATAKRGHRRSAMRRC